MKQLLIGLVLTCSLLAPLQADSRPRWTQRQFILGTFYDPPFHRKPPNIMEDSTRFAQVAAAGFNLLTGWQSEDGVDRSFDGMVYALQLAHSVGLKYLLTDSRYFQASDHDFNADAARSIVRQYQHLPTSLQNAIYGLNLCDEPHFSSEQFARIKAWTTFFDTAWPGKPVYINLVSSYAANYNWGGFRRGTRDEVLRADQRDEYESYLSLYADSLALPIVSYDNYPFFNDGTVRRDYFYNLEAVRRKAHGRPFWAYPMTTGHMKYADPTEAQLFFMYFCPVAYGAKGLVDFTYWPLRDSDFRSALVEKDGRPTPRFEIVKRLNLFIKKVIAPIVMNYKSVQVFHGSDLPDNQLFLSRQDVARKSSPVVADADKRVFVGTFVRGDSTCLLVVNKSLKTVTNVAVTVGGLYPKIRVLPRVGESVTRKSLAGAPLVVNVARERRQTTFTLSELLGGEGRMVRLLRR